MSGRAMWLLASIAVAYAAQSAPPAVRTLVGTGAPGYSDATVNNPYGLVIGPDGALYFCDLDNQRIRRLDLVTRHTVYEKSLAVAVSVLQDVSR